MKDKRAIIGDFMVTFFATIAIVIVLIIFIVGSAIIQKLSGTSGGVLVAKEMNSGIQDSLDYIGDFIKVVKIKSLVANGEKDVFLARGELKYEK